MISLLQLARLVALLQLEWSPDPIIEAERCARGISSLLMDGWQGWP